MNEVIYKLSHKFKKGDTVVAAISGGPDSMVLLKLLMKIENIKIVVAHVNHKLRKESEHEAKMVENFCKKNNLIFEYYEITNYKGNTENYARVKRYNFFDQVIAKYNAKYLLTAHHGDDLIETMLMRLARGTNNLGFKEITKRKNYIIYRPLICVTKDEILEYAKENNIPYAIDETNKSDKFTRNRFRNKILPLLKSENKNIHRNFLKFNESLQKYEDYIDNIVLKEMKKIYKNNIIDIEKLKNQDNLVKEKIIYKILNDIYGDDINIIKEKNVEDILKVIDNKKPNIEINLPKKKQFIKSYDKAYIKEKKQKEKYEYILDDELKLPNNHLLKKITETEEKSNYVIKLDSSEINLPLHVRTRQNGDKMYVKGLSGTKKIKDIFIDEKIPTLDRTNYPLLVDNKGNILWIPGIKKSKFDKSKHENYDIIVKYF